MLQTLSNIYSSYIANILDILVMAYVFYRVILIIKGTRAMQVILGILIILAVTVIVKIMGLTATSWILEKFWLAAVIIFAVVFQVEIRNVFAQLGGQLGGKTSQLKHSYIDEIVSAAEDLSSSMTGALIALEKDTGLKNYMETGVVLNARISRELFLSIFKNKSAPLHDGAVIICTDKIAAAGCLLPLSNSTDVKLYGTRHRAALGLSEITDALVIVVSEETGQISVAYKGKLKGNLSVQKLREIISGNGESFK
ncbi:MAG: diadenylate cyclase CdaA [Endomicrobium sp.]|jgi:diadenylate cyclase|nr:diadenylate cyclase CdaA [Endomicrobium sp.]